MSAANKELSRRFTDLFSTGDEALANEVLSPQVVMHGSVPGGELDGVDAVIGFVAQYRAAFPDNTSRVQEQIAEGDTVVTRWCARGTHRGEFGSIPATGRRYEINGVTIERIFDGRIVEVWAVWDGLELLGQLGVAPQSAPAPAWENRAGAGAR
jgi:steroid delta-isomerase-like uncharacterized protein